MERVPSHKPGFLESLGRKAVEQAVKMGGRRLAHVGGWASSGSKRAVVEAITKTFKK